jgi:hypothetical protein
MEQLENFHPNYFCFGQDGGNSLERSFLKVL